MINPNTVIKVYRELENEGMFLRSGMASELLLRRDEVDLEREEMRDAQQLVREFVDRLKDQGLDAGEIRRLFEAELASEFQRR